MIRHSNDKDLVTLNHMLKAYPLVLDQVDSFVWGQNRIGTYLIKSAYRILMDVPPKWEKVGKVWVKNLISKIGFLSWVAIQNKILTLDNLRKRGFSLANKCTLCNYQEETINHLLLHCEFSKELIHMAL